MRQTADMKKYRQLPPPFPLRLLPAVLNDREAHLTVVVSLRTVMNQQQKRYRVPLDGTAGRLPRACSGRTWFPTGATGSGNVAISY